MAVLQNKIDFALVIAVNHANPNGDPLNGNRPRETYEGLGEISDVCLKRKIRNRMMDLGQNVFVQSDDRCNDGFKSLKDRADGCPAVKKAEKDKDAYAIKLYGEYAGVKMAASYSSVSEGVLPLANTATGFTKTKLYTASILSDGRLAAQPDVKSWKLEASTKLAGFDLGASYASYDVGENNSGAGRLTGLGAYTLTQYQLHKDKSPSEFDFSVGTKIDEVNLTAYYIMQSDYTATAATGPAETRDRTAVRVIASINF